MCGIVGLAGAWQEGLLASLNQSQHHRGPDDSGQYVDTDAGIQLAMRRLSILDIAGGHQPMGNPDGSLWIVFNGEIFNSPDLREALLGRGRRFRTENSDTECLLHLYEERGEAMLDDLNGMFAFAIYDRRRRRLFAARDPFGIKPLYYTDRAGRFAFASELKTLLRLPGFSREIDRQSLYHYLSLRYVPGERSIFRDAKRLPPGHCLIYDLETRSLAVRRYWRPLWQESSERTLPEWKEVLRFELKAAVRRWVLSDVPVACSLSGGLDSSGVVGLLSEQGHPRLRTYSLGFTGAGEERWNELALAREVARRWGTEHHELILTPDQLLEDLVPMVWALDEPYGGGLPSWYVFKFMARDVKVGLTGTGGDELFGGYGKWRSFESSAGKASFSLRRFSKSLLARLPLNWVSDDRRRAWRAEMGPFHHPVDAYPLYLSDAEKREWVASFDLEGIEDTAAFLGRRYDESQARHVRDGFASIDWTTQLPDEFLHMTDRFSMAHSMEARVPLLDRVLVSQVLSIPPRLRTSPTNLKYLFRQAIADLLPAPLRHAGKRGFVLPDTLWLRGALRPLVERLLNPERLARQGLLDPSVYEIEVLPHLEGRRDRAPQVWTLMMFELWHSVFIERATLDTPAFSWHDLAA